MGDQIKNQFNQSTLNNPVFNYEGKKINEVKVDGNGNLVLQDIYNSTITVQANNTGAIENLMAQANKALLKELSGKLEQQGFAQGEAFALLQKEMSRRRARYGWLLGGTAFIAILAVFIAFRLYYTPFDFVVYLHGMEGKDHVVLQNEGVLAMDIGTERKPEIPDKLGAVSFRNIPASFKGEEIQFYLEHPMFRLKHPDSTYKIDPESSLYLEVAYKDLDKVSGKVKNEDNLPVQGAAVNVEELNATTDANGNFNLEIPPALQKKEQRVQIFHPDYQTWDKTIAVNAKAPISIILKYPVNK